MARRDIQPQIDKIPDEQSYQEKGDGYEMKRTVKKCNDKFQGCNE